MKKIYACISFKTSIAAVIASSQLDLLNLIMSIINDDEDIITNRCNCFRQHQAHQASGGVIESIEIMGIGYIGKPKPGSATLTGQVSQIQDGKTVSVISLHSYMDDLIRDATRDLYDTLNTIS